MNRLYILDKFSVLKLLLKTQNLQPTTKNSLFLQSEKHLQ